MKIADITKTTKRSTIKGRIIRSWSVMDFKKPDVVNSMDIVLMDIQVYYYDFNFKYFVLPISYSYYII